MFPTLHDRITGKELSCERWDYSVYWWTEGNGACDCNRSIAMGCDVETANECLTDRYIAVDVHGDLEGLTKEEVIVAMNEGYTYG